jgi:hypothetical protein
VLFLDEVLMVPSSLITVAAEGECLTCGGFSLGKPVHHRNFEFITDYFRGLSLFPKRGQRRHHFRGLNSQRGFYPVAGHDRGLP